MVLAQALAPGLTSRRPKPERGEPNVDMPILKAALFYFAIVVGFAFVLGTIRTLWIVPNIGTRTAELIELPIMFIVSIFAAHLPCGISHVGLVRNGSPWVASLSH